MNSTVAWVLFIASVAVWIVLAAAAPWTISDDNAFLEGFVNHEFLAFMGVVVSITLASASNIYLELNKLEDRVGAGRFTRSKAAVRGSAYSLLWALMAGIVVVISKPLADFGARAEALFNGAAVLIIIFSVIVLTDILQAAFNIDPSGLKKNDDD